MKPVVYIHSLIRSKTFWPAYARLGEVRSFVPLGTLMIAHTATATRAVRSDNYYSGTSLLRTSKLRLDLN